MLLLASAAAAQDDSAVTPADADNAAAVLTEEAIAPRVGATLDWVPIEDVPEPLRDVSCRLCEGRYIDPQGGPNAGKNPESAPINARARSSELEGNTVRLSGGVEVTQGYREFSSDEASIDRETRAGTLEGNIELREPGVLLRGERGEFDSQTGEAQMENSQFVLHEQHLRGSAALLARESNELLRIKDGELTFCAPGDNDWLLQTGELELDLERGVGTARDATLRAGGYPIFYAPWLSFPLDDRRRSGLLFPAVGSDSRGGIDIAVPAYLNLAPNYDLLYSPRYIGQRGLNHEFNARYLDPFNGNWEVGGSYIGNDKQYADDFPDEPDANRWLAVVKHQGNYGGRWRSLINYSKVSDVDLIRDLETSRLDSRRDVNLLQLGQVKYLGDDWLVTLQAQQFQPLAEDIRNDYKKLPQITAQYRSHGEPFTLNPIGMVQYSNFDTDTDLIATGQRLYGEAGVTYPMSWQYGFLRSTAKYRVLEYSLNRQIGSLDENPGARSGLASIDGGLFFERNTQLAGKNVVQTLEPRLFYLYSQYDEQTDQPDFDSAELTFNYNQLFRDTRFSGRDRLDDANQAAIGITTRFLDESTGDELFNASIGQIVYFTNRRVRLNAFAPELDRSSSELAGEFNFYPNDRLSMRSNLQYDPSTRKMNAGNLLASYTRDDDTVFNVGYTFRRPISLVRNQPTTDQVNLSTYYPINNNWRAFLAWNYSLEANRSVEDMVGIEYDSCCWQVRLLHLRYFDTAREAIPDFDSPNLDREHVTQIQVVLKGLGGFGDGVEQLMGDMIQGFNRLAYRR
ncbi:Organic solvent tolerance protein OstA [Congregibacter litoralis KT71]|uniref:LPS-assembly protein LptD n=2 Tax=Congregibacter TaxID=393661 RepID=A4A6U8_9GAMM|nr:Organic solvent tolerance protein OstA [Congregibacter litoralis KT71]